MTKITRTIAHRGPDGEGTIISGNVGLGNRRLAIVDLSETGGQPEVVIRPKLSPGDLLTISRSGKYQSTVARLAWTFYPRWLIRCLGDDYGLALLISATK